MLPRVFAMRRDLEAQSVKVRLGPTDNFFPIPAALVVSGTWERANVVTVAWTGIMSSDPPVIAISLKTTRYSVEHIRDSNEFTVNIPSAPLFKEVDYCGMVSGRVRDKASDLNLVYLKGAVVGTPIIEQCPFNIECKVRSEVQLGQWVVFFGEIVETHVDGDKIDLSSMKIDVARVNPLAYCATVREYWELGRKLGDGFHAGEELRQRLGG